MTFMFGPRSSRPAHITAVIADAVSSGTAIGPSISWHHMTYPPLAVGILSTAAGNPLGSTDAAARMSDANCWRAAGVLRSGGVAVLKRCLRSIAGDIPGSLHMILLPPFELIPVDVPTTRPVAASDVRCVAFAQPINVVPGGTSTLRLASVKLSMKYAKRGAVVCACAVPEIVAATARHSSTPLLGDAMFQEVNFWAVNIRLTLERRWECFIWSWGVCRRSMRSEMEHAP